MNTMAAERHPQHIPSFSVSPDQPLIGLVFIEDGQEVVRYFADEAAADAAALPESVHVALSLAGAWGDLDWNEAEAALDRIRHESQPTPPIENL
jgi:hypothetical protein